MCGTPSATNSNRSKEPFIHQKSHLYTKRAIYTPKEPYIASVVLSSSYFWDAEGDQFKQVKRAFHYTPKIHIYIQQIAMYTPKRAPQSKEPYYTYICIYIYIYTQKKPIYTLKRALRLPLLCLNVWGATCDQFQQELWSKEPYIHPKEPCIHPNDPYMGSPT